MGWARDSRIQSDWQTLVFSSTRGNYGLQLLTYFIKD